MFPDYKKDVEVTPRNPEVEAARYRMALIAVIESTPHGSDANRIAKKALEV